MKKAKRSAVAIRSDPLFNFNGTEAKKKERNTRKKVNFLKKLEKK